MTARELYDWIGAVRGLRTREGFTVLVQVIDARHTYGRTQVQVSPLRGQGRAWVEADRLQEMP
jgi:hypothetical protein